jgi:hypothetical protein
MLTWIRKYRAIPTFILSLAGIGLMLYYDRCNTACSYLQGDIWGIDLKWVGIAFMSVLIVLTFFRQMQMVRMLLAGGLGVEISLYAFQIQHDVYCPFCLAFSVMVILLFILHYAVPDAWRENRRYKWIYFLGELHLPMLKNRKLPLLLVTVAGYLFIWLTFSGSVTPAYGQENLVLIPFLGKGTCEGILFTDNFCGSCRWFGAQAETELKGLIEIGISDLDL